MTAQPMVEDTEKSKWKPLVGTPSKGPIPEDILVPDPSTPRTVSDTESLLQSNSSTPTPSIHVRRRGEHISRPPAFPLPPTPTRAAPPPPEIVGHDSKGRTYTLAFLDAKASDLDDGGTGSPRPQRPSRPAASEIPAFGDLAREYPEYHRDLDQLAKEWSKNHTVVNSMRNRDPLAHFNGGLTQRQNQDENDPPANFASSSSVNDQPDRSRSSAKNITNHSQPANTWRGVENVQEGFQGPDRVADEPPRTARTEATSMSKPTRANSIQSADHLQRSSETSGGESDHVEPSGNSLGGCITNVSATCGPPYAHIETPVLEAAHEMDEYLDLRCKPASAGGPHWDNRISVGSQIAFVGSTKWSNDKGEGVYDVGIPYGTQCYVARIFNDCWALCLKLERGLEPYDGDRSNRLIDRLRRPRTPKSVDRGGKPSIALKNHPVVAIYAPLCAFTLSANYGPYEERRGAVSSQTTALSTWEGGMIQAANRGSSLLFEDEAKRAWKVYVPLEVWNQYKSFCSQSQQTINDLDEITVRDDAASDEALVGRGQVDISTGRHPQSLMSKSGTVKAIKNTAHRVKSVFKPEPVVFDVPSHRIDASRRAPHAISGNPSGLAPVRPNIIPPIRPQPPLRPFEDDEDSESSRPLAAISPNALSSSDATLLEMPHNGNAAQQSSEGGNNQFEVADTGQPLLDVSSGGGPTQEDPHPGVKVTALAGLHPGIEFVPVSVQSLGLIQYADLPR